MAYTQGLMVRIARKVDSTALTWQEIGVHFATLNAMVKRGYMEKTREGKYTMTRKGNMFCKIEDLVAGHEYFVLRNESAKLGMMCSLKGMDILDAWERPWQWGHEGVFVSTYHQGIEDKNFVI